jgi:carbonic anhydrase
MPAVKCEAARESLAQLIAGNDRFLRGTSQLRPYTPEELRDLAAGQEPIAAIIACADSRVTPEIIFDQPLGKLFVSRTPGNVASESSKWMLDIAIEEMKVPLLVVVGHTGCLAAQQVVDGKITGSGGMLRLQIAQAAALARGAPHDDLYVQTVIENAKETVRRLSEDSWPLHAALLEGRAAAVAALYRMETGRVEWLSEV